MVTYRGLPAPVVCDFLTREASRRGLRARDRVPHREDRDGRQHGTYVDAPFHRYPDGKDLSELPLEPLAGRRSSARATSRRSALDVLHGLELRGRAVLFRTGWSRH